MANRMKFTPAKRRRFLEVLRATCNVSEAARRCGLTRRAAYNHREADPAFRADWDEAVEEAIDMLEHEARRRGVDGVDRPISYRGKITDTYKEYSDRMLELLLKAHRPDKYKDRVENQHTGKNGEPLLPDMTVEELIARLLAKRRPPRGPSRPCQGLSLRTPHPSGAPPLSRADFTVVKPAETR